MIMAEESWYVVRNTPGVTGFVGMGNTPTPLRPEEVSQIIKTDGSRSSPHQSDLQSGERVRIVDGPFNDFRGTVSEIDMERAKVRVMVNFFGRETPVELDFLQVEKALNAADVGTGLCWLLLKGGRVYLHHPLIPRRREYCGKETESSCSFAD
jgi:hypothetical protein